MSHFLLCDTNQSLSPNNLGWREWESQLVEWLQNVKIFFDRFQSCSWIDWPVSCEPHEPLTLQFVLGTVIVSFFGSTWQQTLNLMNSVLTNLQTKVHKAGDNSCSSTYSWWQIKYCCFVLSPWLRSWTCLVWETLGGHTLSWWGLALFFYLMKESSKVS